MILTPHLPRSDSASAVHGTRANAERRRQVADELYQALVSGHCSFWDEIHTLFLLRDMTRQDMRELVRRGLQDERGNYRALLTLFGMPQGDCKRFLNFLTTHDCSVDYRLFAARSDEEPPQRSPRRCSRPASRKRGPDDTVEP